MIAPIILGLISIGLSILFSQVRSPTLRLAIAFTPIFIFLGLRYNYGNDYPAYLTLFNEIAAEWKINYDAEAQHAEIGWLVLNRLFAGIGFFPMIISLALFNCYAYVKFIKAYVPEKYFWFALFLYIFVPENMLVQATAMRQTVAIAFFLIGLNYLVERRPLKYVLCVGIAALFHTSALILLPVYFLGARHFPINRAFIPLFLAAYIGILFFSQEVVAFLLNLIIGTFGFDFFDRYSIYTEKGIISSGLGLIFYSGYLSLLIFFHDNQSKEGRVIFKLVIFGIYLIPLSASLAMLARVGFYFSAASIAAAPLLSFSIKSPNYRAIFLVAFICFFSTVYYSFFQSEIWTRGFGEYNTIFSQF